MLTDSAAGSRHRRLVDTGGVEEVARHEHELRADLPHQVADALDGVDARLLHQRPLVRVS